MAESKGAKISKSVQKHAGRAKEKILQNLGKVDRTADEIFDDHLNGFNRQQSSANKLQKEFNNYIRCVRAVQMASKSLMDAVCEIYEPQWSGYDALLAQAQATESLWLDFSHKLADQVLIPLNTYTAQFPEMKKKVEKRNRKLIDYDSQRHSFQNLQANAAKRKDDVKITKGREQLEEARRTYEILNTELHDELPALFDSRILFLVTNLQTLFASEQVFHHETSKIYAELEAIVDKLATDSQRGSYTLKKPTVNVIKTTPTPSKLTNNTNYTNQITNGSANGNSPSPTTSSPSLEKEQSVDRPKSMTISEKLNDNKHISNSDEPSYQNTTEIINKESEPTVITSDITTSSIASATISTVVPTTNGKDIDTTDELNSPNANTIPPITNNDNNTTNNNNITSTTTTITTTTTNKDDNSHSKETEKINGNIEKSVDTKAPAGTELPAGVLYRVKATYSYVKEDNDELSFEIGDTIRVTEYEDPEDQEEGWLMGEKEGTTEKGLFPANFTRPI